MNTKMSNQPVIRKPASLKFQPSTLSLVDFSTNAHFKEYVIVYVGGPGIHPEAFTIHRPIGVTPIDSTEWVCTRTADVHFLLSSEKDPDEARHAKIRENRILDFYLSSNHLVGTKDDPHYPPGKVDGTETNRNKRLAEAERLLSEDMSRARKEHETNQVGKPKKAIFGYGKTKYEFMSSEMKAYEKALKDFSSKDPVLKEELKASKSSYETRGGANRQERQIPIDSVKGFNSDRLASHVFMRIHDVLYPKAQIVPSVNSVEEEINFYKNKIKKLEEESSILAKHLVSIDRWKSNLDLIFNDVIGNKKDALKQFKVIFDNYPSDEDPKGKKPLGPT